MFHVGVSTKGSWSINAGAGWARRLSGGVRVSDKHHTSARHPSNGTRSLHHGAQGALAYNRQRCNLNGTSSE